MTILALGRSMVFVSIMSRLELSTARNAAISAFKSARAGQVKKSGFSAMNASIPLGLSLCSWTGTTAQRFKFSAILRMTKHFGKFGPIGWSAKFRKRR